MSWIEVTSDADIINCIILTESIIGHIEPIGAFPRTLEEIKVINNRLTVRWFAYFDTDPKIVVAFKYSNAIDKWRIYHTMMADNTYREIKFKKYRDFMDEVGKDLYGYKGHLHSIQPVCVDPKVLLSFQNNEIYNYFDKVGVEVIDDPEKEIYIYKVKI